MSQEQGVADRFFRAVFTRWWVGLPLGLLSLAFGIWGFMGVGERAANAATTWQTIRVYVGPVSLTILGCALCYLGAGNLLGWFGSDGPPDGEARHAEPGAAPDCQ